MKPVLIIGAARSGTKILRSIVAASGAYGPVEYDVNYIWRYGNESHSHDELLPEMLTPQIQRFITRQLEKCAGVSRGEAFVEKTVSNVLRVPYVLNVLPEAKFVFLVRDGRDVVESAHRCWQMRPSAGYLLKKLRTFPWISCAGYGRKFVGGVAGRMLGLSNSVKTWGPRYAGIDDDVRQLDLWKVCAYQLRKSIESYEAARHLIPQEQLLEIKYEDLVQHPREIALRLAEFLELKNSVRVTRYMVEQIKPGRIGTHQQITQEQADIMDEIIAPVLMRWGYGVTAKPQTLAA